MCNAQEKPVESLVLAVPDTRLRQLQEAYPAAKAAADAAAFALKSVTDGIKSELAALAPECPAVELCAVDGLPALRLTYSERWTIDTRRLKAEAPETYVRYARQSGAWSLREVRSEAGS